MRGPSASHCAAAVRIGRIARDFMDGDIKEILIEFDPNGSLAYTHASHGSDMGLFGGLVGWDATDDRLVNSEKAIADAGIKTEIKIRDIGAHHPNTYKITLKNDVEHHELTAVSTGGGMIEIIEIDKIVVLISGDYFETILYVDHSVNDVINYLSSNVDADYILHHENEKRQFIEIKSQEFIKSKILSELFSKFDIKEIKTISPVLPVLSNKNTSVPFISCSEMLEYNSDKNLSLWELALQYESARGNLSREKVFDMMKEIVEVMENSIKEGIEGSDYADRILGNQSKTFLEKLKSKQLLEGNILNMIILYVTAIMESKSSMGIVVAAPTAGSCGGLPGACIGTAKAMGLSSDETTKAMLAAGMIGIFIAAHSTFAAEVCGCQAECGAGSGMAAAALITLAGGTLDQTLTAASMALQNTLGMICDPVANRVEVPCLGKNVLAATNAFACANMALADFDPVIPLDEVIETMDNVGKSLSAELRCTALGGLSITKTSREIEKKLQQNDR